MLTRAIQNTARRHPLTTRTTSVTSAAMTLSSLLTKKSPQRIGLRGFMVGSYPWQQNKRNNPQQQLQQRHFSLWIGIHNPKDQSVTTTLSPQIASFHSEAAYHDVADETLEFLQDAVEDVLESKPNTTLDQDDVEVTLAAGVLTLHLPPHGTWVINKQTPNQQLWWSSPLSGPKRYEYDDKDQLWFSTKDGLSLVPFLSQELSHILGENINLDDY